ncbi:MAG TPA: neutral zinc metallopeptidase [Gemmatimonadales bacterium]|jgi:predicted metalloprotease|nr:neutral zinc metallopeptidase [Gemmatimonadales bacterium]
MRWSPGGQSDNVEDLRGQTGGGGGRMRLGLGGFVILLILSLIFKQNFFALLGGGGLGGGAPATELSPAEKARQDTLVSFVSFVLDTTQASWHHMLGNRYHDAKLVLFRDAIQSACGYAQEASGPFYCPGDEKVYIDLGFYDELKQRFGAPGDFAQAYVLAHEIGHHVQKLLGIEPRMRQLQEQHPREANQLSVALELQADCFAGIWGHEASLENILEPGDVEEGLNAAAAVGDDRIQRMSGSRVNPDAFTHGSSAQRVQWFKRGMQSGDVKSCDTFGGEL